AHFIDTDAPLARAAKALARKLEQHATEQRGSVGGSGAHRRVLSKRTCEYHLVGWALPTTHSRMVGNAHPTRLALACCRLGGRGRVRTDDESGEPGHGDVLSGPGVHADDDVVDRLGVVLDELLVHEDDLTVPGDELAFGDLLADRFGLIADLGHEDSLL